MLKRFSANYMAILFLLDGLLYQAALWLAPLLTDRGVLATPGLHLQLGLCWLLAFLVLDVYNPSKGIRWSQEGQRVFMASVLAGLMLAGLLYLSGGALPREVFIIQIGIAAVLIWGYRIVLRLWHRWLRLRQERTHGVNRVLVLGAGDIGVNFAREFINASWSGLELAGFLDDEPVRDSTASEPLPGVGILGTINSVTGVVTGYRIRSIVIALPRWEYSRIARLISELSELPVNVHVVPDYFDTAFFNFTVDTLGGIPVIGLREPAIDGFQRVVKRVVDLLLGALLVVCAAPLLAVVAAAIWLEDRGPVFYWTDRVGENREPFRMLKLRSMRVGAEALQEDVNETDEAGNVIHKQRDDPRVTRVGRFIRKYSVDELPNLWNVLKGEMSLVGPRPELPWLVDKYKPWQLKRFAVPQGMTGWWQVTGRSDKPMHLHTEDDIYYIQNHSLWLDLQIMWRTIAVVVRGRGAY